MTFVGSDISGLPSIKSCGWSYFKNTIAVITTDFSVHFYDESGTEKEYQPVTRNAQATIVEWCPNCDVLAIGWSDGVISIWNEGNNQNSKFSLEKSITLIEWHPSLPILLAASVKGTVMAIDCTSQPHKLFDGKIDSSCIAKATWLPRDTPFAFIASEGGKLFTFENAKNSIKEVSDIPTPINTLMVSQATGRLIAIGGDNTLVQFSLPPSVQVVSEINLSVGESAKVIKLRPDTICYAIGNQLNVSSLSSDDSAIIRAPGDDTITSIYFDVIDAILYATTQSGKLLCFRSTMKGMLSKAGWSQPTVIDLGSRVDSAIWSTATCAFVASIAGRKPLIFRRVLTHSLSNKEVTLWQPDTRTVQSGGTAPLKVPYVIESISSNTGKVLISSQTQSSIYSIRSNELSPFSDSFQTKSAFTTIYNENTYECTGKTIIVRTLQGVTKQTVALGTNSSIIKFASNGAFICVMTEDFSVFLFDISRRSPKLQFSTQFTTSYDLFRVRDISLSCGGFCISATVDYFDDNKWKPAPDLFLHSPQFDKTVAVPFDGRVPKEHQWDHDDPRLLCAQVIPYQYDFESKLSGILIFPLFVADTLDVYRQTPLTIDEKQHLCGVDIPNVLITDYANAPSFTVLPQFEGLDNADEESKKALMELNFHLATGDIDAAFNSIRGINNKGTWRSLAQTCAQMRRIDLADLCFGRMEEGGSALLLHKARAQGEVDAMSVVDTQLGIYNEAKNVAKDNKRYDILANIHRSLGEWNDALTIARTQDRIHQKVISYDYARSLEIMGEYQQALQQYEESGTLGEELTRLAVQHDKIKIIFDFVSERNPSEIPPKITLWLARFFEAHNQVDMSLDFYQRAGALTDYVRLLCINSRWEEADKYVQKSTKRSVICSYARILCKRIEYLEGNGENTDKLKHQVIELFRKARQFGQALLFALDNQMIDDIFSLSFSAPPTVVCKAAQWFEEQKELKNAILLYNRAGRTNKALSLCFKNRQYDALDEISDGLNSKTDPNILIICGKYFTESERWSKAATCYALAKQFEIVIQLCNNHNIKLSPNVIQDISEDTTNNQYDTEIIKKFAALCEQQHDFITASKLYLKLKDHISSIKVLIRAGETNKVVKFAKLFRKRETYILAANYLQTLNPHQQPALFGIIVEFYTKANAPDKLARFYESSSQIEIDEYQEYEKGLEYAKKSYEILDKIENLKNKDVIMSSMKLKIKLIILFLQAKELVSTEPKKALAICVELLRTKEIETCLKSDDIYIVMVHCYTSQGNYKNAYKILDDLKNSGTDLTMFMDIQEIEDIYKKAGQTYDGPRGDEDDGYDEIDDADIEDI